MSDERAQYQRAVRLLDEAVDLCHAVIHRPKRYADPAWRLLHIRNEAERLRRQAQKKGGK